MMDVESSNMAAPLLAKAFGAVLFSMLVGVGVVESVIFIPLMPVFVAFLVYVLWKRGTLSLARVTWMGALAAAGLGLYYVFASRFFVAADCDALGYKSVMDVMVSVWKKRCDTVMR